MQLLKRLSLLILIIICSCSAALSKEPGDSSVLSSPDSANNQNVMGTICATGVIFTKLDQKAEDIGCGSEGDLCVAGLDGKLYCYDFYRDTWESIPLNEEISGITRVDIDDDGRIYIVTECGIFFLDCNDTWVRLPGTAKDIGVGANFDVWKIGTDKEGLNYGVWKLFCECDCNCVCTRVCIRFRKLRFALCSPIVKRRCYWFRAEIRGVNVDVFPNGDAAVVAADGKVYIVDGHTFEYKLLDVKNTVFAVDVTVGNNGVLFVTASDYKIYKYNPVTKMWAHISSATEHALRICASAYDLPSYVSHSGWVYTSIRYDYLPCIEP